MITEKTRNESLKTIDKQNRYNEILNMLREYNEGPTAREIANKLGYIERNATAPRLTELCGMGKVEAIAKRRDEITGKTVAVYALKSIKNRTCTCIEKCENCKYGYTEYKGKILKRVHCKKI